jgi:hypothetical protein
MPEQVRYWTKPRQSRIFFGPVPEKNYGCQNADPGVSFLNSDAQLCEIAVLNANLANYSNFCYSWRADKGNWSAACIS